jgi:hypothetical protein
MAESQGKFFNESIAKNHKYKKSSWVYLKN